MYDVDKSKVNDFMKAVENLKTSQENISIHVYSRTGINFTFLNIVNKKKIF